MLDYQYLYLPSPWESHNWRSISGLPLEEVWFAASDDTKLFGWYVEAPARKAVLLWCHGNAGNIIHRLDNVGELYKRGLSVFIFDYRGYGRSAGKPSEAGLYADALAAYDYLIQVRMIKPEELVIFGRSLGASVAGDTAAMRKSAGLILETPFPSIEAVARKLYFGLPAHRLLEARFELAKRLEEIHTPALVIHGDADSIIPFELGRAVFVACNDPKEFFRIPGADHNNTYLIGGEVYFKKLLDFVRRATETAGR